MNIHYLRSEKAKTIALKASKKKTIVSSDEDSDIDEDAVVMLAKNFEWFMENNKFKNENKYIDF